MRILVLGGTGFLGRYVCRLFRKEHDVIAIGSSCDLRKKSNAYTIINMIKPECIVHLSAVVGGIGANQSSPKKFLMDNLNINMNVIQAAADLQIERLLAIGSVCAYPENTAVPFKEEDIWNGYPEATNSPYGISKRVLLELCKVHGYKMVIPTNLYGPGADANLATSHVVPALIRKCLIAKKEKRDLSVWGTGKATRDFLFVRDAAAGIAAAVKHYDTMPLAVNLATGREVSIRKIVSLICKIAEFEGDVSYDALKPDGQLRRCVDISLAKTWLQWQPTTDLGEGLRETIEYYNENF